MAISERPHKHLLVWQKSMELVETVYAATRAFPKEEQFGLTSQMRRAAVSVPSNIAEGLARRTVKDKVHFLGISQGSLSELDTDAEIAHRLGMLEDACYEGTMARIVEVQKLLSGLTRSLNA